MSDLQEVYKHEEKYQGLKHAYAEAMNAFLDIPPTPEQQDARRNALQSFHLAGIAFFTAFERLFVVGSLSGAATNRVWYLEKAETAVNLLETITKHYAAVIEKAEELGLGLDHFKPSPTSFGTIQRLVNESHQSIVSQWRTEFERLGLPVPGFVSGPQAGSQECKADLLLVTVNEIETQTVLEMFAEVTGEEAIPETIDDRLYRNLGIINGTRIWHAISEMGSSGVGAMQQTVGMAIRALSPRRVIGIGVGFGVNAKKQKIGDILISHQIQLYELQRVGKKRIIPRGDKPHASASLINYCKGTQATWKDATIWTGLILTGEKLVDNIDYRNQLLKMEAEAIGGEMEGMGLYVSCLEYRIDWLLIKAICDWADGLKKRNKKARQRKAAANACRFLIHSLRTAKLTV